MNTTVVYILSVVGLLCCCLGGLGIIPSGIAYYMASNQEKVATLNPENYENPKAIKTAKMIAMIILIINIVYLIYTVYRIYTIGWDNLMEESRMRMEEMGY